MQEKIKVEIFRDNSALSDIDTDFALKGLAKVSQHINIEPFQIMSDSRKIRIARDNTTLVDVANIRWGELEADYSIILTDRPIVDTHARRELHGITQRLPNQSPIKGAILVHTGAVEPELITAHETGHLMGLRYPDGDELGRHCTSPACLMYKHMSYEHTTERVVKKGYRAFLEHQGLRPADYIKIERSIAQDFCTPCIGKLSRQAFYALKYLNGETVLADWLQ